MVEYKEIIETVGTDSEEVISNFLKDIKAQDITHEDFVYNNEKWFLDRHPWEHSDDIIVRDTTADEYDKFLLVKTGSNRTRIVGWCDKKILTSVPARDIYRNGTKCFVVMFDNLNNLSSFKILKQDLVLKKEFIINQQEADSAGNTEMISGILAGLHYFTKKTDLYFKDINQQDEFVLGELKGKIFTRDYMSDEDMLIPEAYFLNHSEIDIYMLCKIKGGRYNYLGYVDKAEVERTRVVSMAGNVDIDKAGDAVRRIFSDQYKNLSDFIKIYEEEKKEEIIITPQSYVPLHAHSEWSVGDGFGTVKYIAETLKKQGFKSCALTDHGTMAGVFDFQKACLLKDIKPIIGCEFYLSFPGEEKSSHITVLVKNKIGWSNILKLQALGVRENFYYHPTVPIAELLKNHEGLIVLSGCMSSQIVRYLLNNQTNKAEEIIKQFKETFKDDFYLEIMPHTIENYQEAMEELYNFSEAYDIKCVLTTDSHYPLKTDVKYHEAIKAINFKKDYGEAGFDDNCFYLMQDKDIEEKISTEILWMKNLYKDFLSTTNEIADKCNFKIEPGKEKDTLPKLNFGNKTPDEKLKELVFEGLTKYTKYNINQPEIKARLDLELDRIISKGYTNYFLIVADMVNWAKQTGIFVGPGRGSVGASLAALCLNITECDPIEHDLLFDRFLSVIRKDMPDADLDFQDDRREEIFNYLITTYGADHCAKIATYARFHPKGVLRDLGRIFNVPSAETNKICSLVIERSSGDARASMGLQDTFEEFVEAKEFAKKYPDVADIAMKLEGNIRHKSSHAAGMITSEKDIASYVPINKIGGVMCTEWEKFSAEEMNLVKFDILGLSTLTILQDAAKSAGVSLPKEFNDPIVYEKIFKPANNVGIFQLGTCGMMKFSEGLNISSFSDLYDATTLFRPACISGSTKILKNNGANIFAERPINRLTKISNLDLIEAYGEKFEKTKGNAFYVGKKQLFRIETEDGNFIDIGEDHEVMTQDGWKKVKDLTCEDSMTRVEPEENMEYVKCKVCKAKRKNLARNHLSTHKLTPKQYSGKLFSEDEEIKVKRIMSDMGKKGYIAQQKVQTVQERVALAVKACKNNPVFRERNRQAQLKIRDQTSKRRIQFLKDHPEKHPCVIMAKNGNISYQQVKLFNLVKAKYSDAILEHAFLGMIWCADIFIPSLNADIEYDGKKWHSQPGCKEKDNRRDIELLKNGIKVIRVGKESMNRWEELLNEKISSKN